MLTIRFKSGQQKQIEADTVEVQQGALVVCVYTKDRESVQSIARFAAERVDWARLDNGTFVMGNEPDESASDRLDANSEDCEDLCATS